MTSHLQVSFGEAGTNEADCEGRAVPKKQEVMMPPKIGQVVSGGAACRLARLSRLLSYADNGSPRGNSGGCL